MERRRVVKEEGREENESENVDDSGLALSSAFDGCEVERSSEMSFSSA